MQIQLALMSMMVIPQALGSQEARPPSEPAAVILRFEQPAAGTSSRLEFAESTDLIMTYFKTRMEDTGSEREGKLRQIKTRAGWAFTDRWQESGRLRRTYAGAKTELEMMRLDNETSKPDGDAQGTSALVGTVVEFRPKGEGMEATYAEGEEALPNENIASAPDPDLAVLDPDVSFQSLLPSGSDGDASPVAVGSEWNVEPDAIMQAFAPGGRVETYYGEIQNQRDPDLLAIFGGHRASQLTGKAEGQAAATLLRTAKKDGVELAHIQIKFKIVLQRDTSPWMHAQSEPFEMAAIGQTVKDLEHSMALEGEATLLWDVNAHRMTRLTLVAETACEFKFDFAFEMRGMSFAGDEHAKLTGETHVDLVARYAGE